MASDLLFEGAPFNGLPVGLVFGATGTATVPAPIVVTMAATFAAPTFNMVAVYDNRLTRWRDQRVTSPMGGGQRVQAQTDALWSRSNPELGGTVVRWDKAQQIESAARVVADHSVPIAVSVFAPWVVATPVGAAALAVYETALRVQRQTNVLWQVARAVGLSADVRAEIALRQERGFIGLWGSATGLDLSVTARMRTSQRPLAYVGAMPWQLGKNPPNGRADWPPLVVNPPVHQASLELLFQCPLLGAPYVLLFGDRPCYLTGPLAPLFILPSRFYMTVNTVQAVLLPSLEAVPLYTGTTISADVGSYGWTLNATGPVSLYEQLKPAPGQPKQIRVTINGIDWVFAVNHPSKSESFGKKVAQITGTSVTSALGPAFALETARMNAAPFNAQQLAAAALDNTGIALDWGIDDWLVPAGAWSHYGTPLAAVQAIAQAAGGYVQSGRSAAVLQVRHPYPLLPGGVPGGPWNWNGAFAADVSLAPDVIVSRSEDLRDAPAVNAVYVSGTSQGVLALVKRAGTAGDLLGAQITDALITANLAAQQRGLSVLGAAGGRIMRRLELPVLTGVNQPGVLSTDQLIEVTDAVPWRGRVRAVSVTASSPSVRQNVLVEVA